MKISQLKTKLMLLFLSVFAACFTAGIALISAPLSAAAEESGGSASILSDSAMISDEYLDGYSYGTQSDEEVYISAYSNNGGNYPGNVLTNAFDRNPSTFWESYTSNSDSFKNCVTVTFSAQAQIDRIIYMSRADGYPARGYPLVLTVYISEDDSGSDFTQICQISSSLGGNTVLFDLGGTYSCRRIRLEYTAVNSDINTWPASAAELIFLKPEEEAVRAVRSAFSDYACLTLTPEFRSDAQNILAEAKKTVAYSCGGEVEMLVTRAENILSGKISYDENRELSTAEGALNPIARAGDVQSYARNDLKMVWMGTNRQVTGIGAAGGETLVIFVEADEGDPLPSVVCTQFLGTWQGWRSGTIALSRGINYVTVPDYYQGWSNTVSGGPVYIVNPYTKSEQSGNVKVYIEGGYTYPVFRQGGDEEAYLSRLESYLEEVNNSDCLPDMTELTNNNVIVTVTASQACKQYVTGDYSPQSALEGWAEYLNSLYEFCGVFQDEYSDPRAEYLNVNIRVMQPLSGAAAYAYTEHVGIIAGSDWETIALRGENFGWGVSHELGHMMDISERTWAEYTNNMWSQYNKCALAGEDARGNFASFLSATVTDGVPYEERQAYLKYTSDALSWWVIESRYPGFWGRFENCYRYGDRAGITDKAELHVYFASLAAGADLSYYFERIGFNWNGNDPFYGYDNASEQFKSAISAALSSGKIKSEGLKLWYLDASAYNYTVKYGDGLSLYDGTEQVSFRLGKSSGGITVLLDGTSDYRHLGYEILRGNESEGYSVIGFTYGRSFTDTSYEEGMSYKVRAYDRALGCSALSAAQAYNSAAVARVNGQDYSALSEAFAAAASGDTVYLLSDAFAAGITVDKELCLAPLSSDCTIYLSESSAMFTVASGAEFTIRSEEYLLTLDGVNASKSDALIVSAGTLSISGNVKITNSVSTGVGGALRVPSGTVNIGEGVIFSGNSAAYGGAVGSRAGGSAVINISGATFADNGASSYGGAVYATCYLNIADCVFSGNSAAGGGAVCLNDGGILTVKDCTFRANSATSQGGALMLNGKTTFSGTTLFEENSAAMGGGVYMQSSNAARRVTLSNAVFYRNAAECGGAVFISGYAAIGAQDSTLVIDAPLSGSSALYISEGADLSAVAGTLNLRGGVEIFSPLSFGSSFDAQNSSLNAAFTFNGEGEVLASFASDGSAMALRSFILSSDGAYAAEFSEDGKTISAGSVRAYSVTVESVEGTDFEYFLGGESFVLPQAAEREGYVFKGWQCGGTLYAAGQTVEVSSDMAFVAVYEEEQSPEEPENPDGSGDSESGADEDAGNPDAIPAWTYAVIAGAGVIVFAAVVTIVVYARNKRKK